MSTRYSGCTFLIGSRGFLPRCWTRAVVGPTPTPTTGRPSSSVVCSRRTSTPLARTPPARGSAFRHCRQQAVLRSREGHRIRELAAAPLFHHHGERERGRRGRDEGGTGQEHPGAGPAGF